MFKYRIVSRKDPQTKVKKYYAQGVVIPRFFGGGELPLGHGIRTVKRLIIVLKIVQVLQYDYKNRG